MHEPGIYIPALFNHKNAVQNLEILMIHLHSTLQTIFQT